jgi:hypothetical protein
MHSGNPNIARAAGQLRSSLDDALEASTTDPTRLTQLRALRTQYKNLMTVAPLVAKADVEGHISPALLRGAMLRSFKNAAFQGAGDIGELAQIAQTFMKEPPNSGTPARLSLMLKSFGGLGAIGAIPAAIFAFQHEPHAAAAGAGAGVLTALSRLGGDLYNGAQGRSESNVAALAGVPSRTPIADDLISRLTNYLGHAQVQAGGAAGRGLIGVVPALRPSQQIVPQIHQQGRQPAY